VLGGAEGELWPVPERKTAAAALQLTRVETESSATWGASVKLQHDDEHLQRGRRMVSGSGQCKEKTVAQRAHPGGGKTSSGRVRGVDGGFNPATPVSGRAPSTHGAPGGQCHLTGGPVSFAPLTSGPP
jgi:hypothetical protein